MATATPTETPRRARGKADRKAADRALACWSDCLAALEKAAAAAEALSDAMDALPLEESDRLEGEEVSYDAWLAAGNLRTSLGMLVSAAPANVVRAARNANAAL